MNQYSNIGVQQYWTVQYWATIEDCHFMGPLHCHILDIVEPTHDLFWTYWRLAALPPSLLSTHFNGIQLTHLNGVSISLRRRIHNYTFCNCSFHNCTFYNHQASQRQSSILFEQSSSFCDYIISATDRKPISITPVLVTDQNRFCSILVISVNGLSFKNPLVISFISALLLLSLSRLSCSQDSAIQVSNLKLNLESKSWIESNGFLFAFLLPNRDFNSRS